MKSCQLILSKYNVCTLLYTSWYWPNFAHSLCVWAVFLNLLNTHFQKAFLQALILPCSCNLLYSYSFLCSPVYTLTELIWPLTAITDTGLLNGFLFSFSINLLVWFVHRLNWLPVGFWLHVKHLHSDSDSMYETGSLSAGKPPRSVRGTFIWLLHFLTLPLLYIYTFLSSVVLSGLDHNEHLTSTSQWSQPVMSVRVF